MSTRSQNRTQLGRNLRSKTYRDAFVETHIRNGLAFQIRAMRDVRKWTQKTLAERAETKQEVVCRLENPDYGRFTLETLRRLASAFDVALMVRFVPFSELLNRVSYITPQDLEVLDFNHDAGLQNWEATAANVYSIFPSDTLTVSGVHQNFISSSAHAIASNG